MDINLTTIKSFILLVIGITTWPHIASAQQDFKVLKGDKTLFAEYQQPYIQKNLIERLRQGGRFNEIRTPYLVYYAVDSVYEEPYLDASIKEETQRLRDICRPEFPFVNWIIIQNTQVLESQTYDLCHKGQFKRKNIAYLIEEIQSNYEEAINLDLESRCDNVSIFDHMYYCGTHPRWRDMGYLPHKALVNQQIVAKSLGFEDYETLPNEKSLTPLYRTEYPLLDKFFFQAVFQSSNRLLHPFNPNDYVPMVHIKTHTHYDFAMTSLIKHRLHEVAVLEKHMLEQSEQLKDEPRNFHLIRKGLSHNVFNSYKLIEQHLLNINQDEQLFGLIDVERPDRFQWFGEDLQDNFVQYKNLPQFCQQNQKAFELNHVLYPERLIGTSPSILEDLLTRPQANKVDIHDAYLGQHIGIDPVGFINSFKNLGADDKELSQLLIFLEGLDYPINQTRWKLTTDLASLNSGVTYIPKGKLWYRNIDWHHLFMSLAQINDQKAHATVMQSLFIEASKFIPNYRHILSDRHQRDYDRISTRISVQSIGE